MKIVKTLAKDKSTQALKIQKKEFKALKKMHTHAKKNSVEWALKQGKDKTLLKSKAFVKKPLITLV